MLKNSLLSGLSDYVPGMQFDAREFLLHLMHQLDLDASEQEDLCAVKEAMTL